jgi:hypothetical protein
MIEHDQSPTSAWLIPALCNQRIFVFAPQGADPDELRQRLPRKSGHHQSVSSDYALQIGRTDDAHQHQRSRGFTPDTPVEEIREVLKSIPRAGEAAAPVLLGLDDEVPRS